MSFWNLTQSGPDAQAGIDRLTAARIKQLQAKADAGTITAAQADELAKLTGGNASDYLAADPLDEAWTTFNDTLASEVTNLPATIQNGVGNAASWAGQLAGNTGGSLIKGFFKGWANWATLGLFAVGAFVLWWAFTRGPLKGAKLKTIPV